MANPLKRNNLRTVELSLKVSYNTSMLENRESVKIPYKNLSWVDEVSITADLVSHARQLWESGDPRQARAVTDLVSSMQLLPHALKERLQADAAPLFMAFDKTVEANSEEKDRPVYNTKAGTVYRRIGNTLKIDELRTLMSLSGLTGEAGSVDEVAQIEGCAKISVKHKYLAGHRELSRMLSDA